MLTGATLHGGYGDLTDSVVADQNRFEVEDTLRNGPYVGW